MRFTFGTTYLIGGVQFVAPLIGLFAFSQCLVTAEESMKEYKREKRKKLDQILPSKSDIKRTSPTILMCSIIGTIIGAIPGTGGDIASWIGYNESKRWSKHPEEFGHGAPEGIAAPEAANNAVSGGAMIPLLTLGIPGDSVTAIMLGALMMQGITPDRRFQHPDGGCLLHHYLSVYGQRLHVLVGLWCYPHLLQNQPGTYEVAEPHCVCLLCGRHLCHQ